MNAPQAEAEIARARASGVLILGEDGRLLAADPQARRLLGWDGQSDSAWDVLRPRLARAGLPLSGEAAESEIELEEGGAAGRPLLFSWRGGAGGVGVVALRDAATALAESPDLRFVSQMRSLARIAPAVAHDLRAPINAMVLNLEVLKETLASGRGAAPGGRERQLRYVDVLKEELARLHGSLENFLAHISPRGDRTETLDLRGLIVDLAGLLVPPARKELIQVRTELPDDAVSVAVNRYLTRQALLHLGLAVLERTPREGIVGLALTATDGRAHIHIGVASGNPATQLAAAGFAVVPTASGTLADLHVARAILSAEGAAVAIEAANDGSSGIGIDLPISA